MADYISTEATVTVDVPVCTLCRHPIHGIPCRGKDRWGKPCGCDTPYVRSATGGRNIRWSPEWKQRNQRKRRRK